MFVRALRGVCIGVERHLRPGDTADLDAAQVQFLVHIGAVEIVPEPPRDDSDVATDSAKKVAASVRKTTDRHHSPRDE